MQNGTGWGQVFAPDGTTAFGFGRIDAGDAGGERTGQIVARFTFLANLQFEPCRPRVISNSWLFFANLRQTIYNRCFTPQLKNIESLGSNRNENQLLARESA
jgi:hypothetical protein